MACFTIPLAEAIVVTVVEKIALRQNTKAVVDEAKNAKIVSIKEKLGTLKKMLYGGSFLLAIEHIYHGEIIFYPPFLSAMKNPEDAVGMLHEMSTVGVGMALLVTGVWAIVEIAKAIIKKNKANSLNARGTV